MPKKSAGIHPYYLDAVLGLGSSFSSEFSESSINNRRVLGILRQQEAVYKNSRIAPAIEGLQEGEIEGSTPDSLENYRHIFRGMRWILANMLAWEKPAIMLPEDLNRNLLLS